MIIFKKYQYCELCGKKLKINDLGIKNIGYNPETGEPVKVHEYGLVCPSSNEPSHHIYDKDSYLVGSQGVYIYQEPI